MDGLKPEEEMSISEFQRCWRSLALQWRETPGFGSARLGVSADGAYLHGLWYEDTRLRGVWAGPRDPRDPEPLCAIDTEAWPDE